MTLTAVPSAGYIFDSWSGETQGISDLHQNPVVFRMGDDTTDNNREMMAYFVSSDLHYALTTACEPAAGGSVALQPEQPSGGYQINTTVTVSAVAETGYIFSRWASDLAGSDNPRTIRISEDKSVTAIFNPTVSVYCSPSQGGSVSLQPESTNGYDAGTKVTMTAVPAKGYRFASWEGDMSGSAKSVTITVDEAKTITARFAEKSQPRTWLWVLIGVVGLLAGLLLLRLVYARMGRRDSEQSSEYDD